MEKLVRDNIPEIAENKGQVPVIRTASKDEFMAFLLAKLMEESLEAMNTNDDSDLQTELADVLEVVYTIAHQIGISPRRLEWIRHTKAEVFGSFSKRIIWYGNQGTK